MSAATHFVGFVVAIYGLIFLLGRFGSSGARALEVWVYGGSLCGMFLSSTLFHALDLGAWGNAALRRLDHGAIFALIAGTYTPASIHLLEGTTRWAMLGAVGLVAVVGIALKLMWVDWPAWMSTALYLGFGWMAVLVGPTWWRVMTVSEICFLAGGGLAYTVGAVIYVLERPDPWPEVFGHHEVWHLFVLAGAALHFGFVYLVLHHPIPG